MIKVLIVDDSSTMRLFLEQVFAADPEIRVVGSASNAEEALAEVERMTPDVITMDIHMPGMNGLELVAEAMR